MDDAVLTLTELCERWKCDRKTILWKIQNGKLKAFRVGARSFRVAMAEVLRVELCKDEAA